MGHRTHFKWLDSHFRSPTLKGCFVIFIPHNTSCGCGGGIWSQTKLPQALAFLLALGAYPHNRLMCRSGFPHLIPTNSAYCPELYFNKIRLHIFAIFIARHCLLPRCLQWFRWIHQPSGGRSGLRPHGRLSPTLDFESSALNLTLPSRHITQFTYKS